MTISDTAAREQIGPSQAPTLVPAPHDLPDVLPTDMLNTRGMATPVWRDDLRRISNVRNGFTVAGALLQSFGVVIAAAWINTWWSYLLAFVLMTRGHVCLNILAHEAAHRLLFTNRKLNDNVGRWLLAYPTFQAMLVYRRVHFAHHRDEMGPDEPDLGLYAGYPISRDSWHRKLRRDAFGNSASKNFSRSSAPLRGRQKEALQIFAVQGVMLGASLVFMRPLAYVVWVGSWATLWKVSNRLRSIAEHGGHGPLQGPPHDHARHPPEPSRPLLDGPVQHRMAPRPSRRHGCAVAEPAPPARRTRPLRMGDRGDHVSDVPGLLACCLVGQSPIA